MSFNYLHGRKSISTNKPSEITANIYVTSYEGEITNEIIIIIIILKKKNQLPLLRLPATRGGGIQLNLFWGYLCIKLMSLLSRYLSG